ncbi:5590_t:CDS:1, partial [Acaulospora morrowiae]
SNRAIASDKNKKKRVIVSLECVGTSNNTRLSQLRRLRYHIYKGDNVTKIIINEILTTNLLTGNSYPYLNQLGLI